MTDNLRDRIAAVIEAQQVCEYQGSIHPEDVMRLADAVIAELGLKRMEMEVLWVEGEWDVLAQGFRGFRYVTPWDVDDE